MSDGARVEFGDESVAAERRWEAPFGSPEEFRVEKQDEGSTVAFESGGLRVNCPDWGLTVWARRTFPADLLVEYTATCREPDGTSSRNLNCFLCAANDEEPLESNPRDGGYPDYHDWPNYIFTLTKTHSRLRRDPGFEQQSEFVMGIQPDESYTVRVRKEGGRIRARVNGRLIHDWTDPDPHGAGWVGLRTYDTDVVYDDWTVYEL